MVKDIETSSGTPPDKSEYYPAYPEYPGYQHGRPSVQIVPQPVGSTLGSPVNLPNSQTLASNTHLHNQTALAIGAFATTLTTLSCALMGFRGLSTTNVFVADFNFV